MRGEIFKLWQDQTFVFAVLLYLIGTTARANPCAPLLTNQISAKELTGHISQNIYARPRVSIYQRDGRKNGHKSLAFWRYGRRFSSLRQMGFKQKQRVKQSSRRSL